MALGILNRKRTLSNDLLGQIFILKRTDVPNEYHVLLHVAHLITDGMGNTTLLRTLLDTLSSSVGSPIPDLEERLAMVWGIDNLKTETDVTMPQMRQMQAMTFVIWANHVSELRVCVVIFPSYMILKYCFFQGEHTYSMQSCSTRYVPTIS